MATLFLLRHGRSSANTKGVLAGRRPGVHLDDVGRSQAQAAADRLIGIKFKALVSSPLERCRETIDPLAAVRRIQVHEDERFIEADYGSWSGKKLTTLAKQPLWRTVQEHPSAVRFPGATGESMTGMQQRALDGVRAWNRRVGTAGVYLVCSHGDVIKAILADALGMHLDQFQRIVVDPASVSVIRYTELRPFVLTTNSSAGELAHLGVPPASTSSDAAVGGGAGTPAEGAKRRR